MKRIRIILSILSLAVLAAACGKDEPVVDPNPAPDSITVTPSSDLVFEPAGGKVTLTVVSPAKPAVSCDSWISIPAAPYNSGTYKSMFTVTVDKNPSYEERSGKISISATGAAAVTINVRQKAEEAPVEYGMNPAKSLTDAAATKQVRNLYQFFLDNYGKKTVSGAMGGDAWGTGFTDYISSLAGRYPAILGLDFLFMNWPAKAWDGCPDYTDITPVKNAYDAGNIIQICWHWNVPPAEDKFVDVDAEGFKLDSDTHAKLSSYSYNTKQFSAIQAVKEGTWQNKVINYQIAKVAGYLKNLQDAGIPVLFRPMHEAAGDYTWGAWFWWGYDGPEACVNLWKYLRNQLENTYGIHNLVWVWTMQTSKGGSLASESDLQAWYPGDAYVDMVGADLYEAKGTSQSARFKLINNAVKGGKIVALCEFGNLLDIDKYFAEEAPWAYFLSWSSSDSNGNWLLYNTAPDGSYGWNNTADDWKAALGNSHTINRDGVPSMN